jgi:hypothetical protein
MAAVDILRDRERGLPRYNQARRQYGLEPAKSFADITDHPLARAALPCSCMPVCCGLPVSYSRSLSSSACLSAMAFL